MARYCIILFIVLLSCVFLFGATFAQEEQEKEPGWQREIIKQIFNATAIGRKHYRQRIIYNSDVCAWGEVSCDLNIHITKFMVPAMYYGYSIPEKLGQLSALEILSIADAFMEDRITTIPSVIGDLTKLQYLRLGSLLSGSIPDSFESLVNLAVLDLSENNFTYIPSWVENLPKLTRLHLNFNKLTGTIPNELCRGSLTDLYLHNNQLTGSVPPVIAESDLKNFFINDNSLTIFAESITRPPKLQLCDMSNNPFVCPIPQWAIDECQATCTTIEPFPSTPISNTTIAIIIASACALAIIIVGVTLFISRRRVPRANPTDLDVLGDG